MERIEVLKEINTDIYTNLRAKEYIYRGKTFVIGSYKRVETFYKTKRGAEGYIKRERKVSYYDEISLKKCNCGEGLGIFEIQEDEIVDLNNDFNIWYHAFKDCSTNLNSNYTFDKLKYFIENYLTLESKVYNYVMKQLDNLKKGIEIKSVKSENEIKNEEKELTSDEENNNVVIIRIKGEGKVEKIETSDIEKATENFNKRIREKINDGFFSYYKTFIDIEFKGDTFQTRIDINNKTTLSENIIETLKEYRESDLKFVKEKIEMFAWVKDKDEFINTKKTIITLLEDILKLENDKKIKIEEKVGNDIEAEQQNDKKCVGVVRACINNNFTNEKKEEIKKQIVRGVSKMNELIKTLGKAKKELNKEYNIILKIRIEETENTIKKQNMNEIRLDECIEFLKEVLDINNLKKYKNNLIEGMEYTLKDEDLIKCKKLKITKEMRNSKYIVCKTNNTVNVKIVNGEKEINLSINKFLIGFQIALLRVINKKYNMNIEKVEKEIEIKLSEDLKSDFKQGLRLKAIDNTNLVLKHSLVGYTVRKNKKDLVLKDFKN